MKREVILIVDDEKDVRNIVEIYLENNGYQTIQAGSGREALDILEKESVDLAVIDIMMPEMDGIQLCMRIRETRNIPIIMLSAKDQDMDKVMGLSVGADDYMSKPFNPVELLARVRAQLRRFTELNPSQENVTHLEYQGLTMCLDTHQVILDGKEIPLTPTEFRILELLWRNKGIVFSTERIYNRIWREDSYEVDNTVLVHIRNLRAKIERDRKTPAYIRTVWGVGYKFGE
ncbi:MAG TPA: response regulator transcription factor [Lachnospiraceae bacterium]|nr:response regulator transcription factor [Lachnospiraceae bacterium]